MHTESCYLTDVDKCFGSTHMLVLDVTFGSLLPLFFSSSYGVYSFSATLDVGERVGYFQPCATVLLIICNLENYLFWRGWFISTTTLFYFGWGGKLLLALVLSAQRVTSPSPCSVFDKCADRISSCCDCQVLPWSCSTLLYMLTTCIIPMFCFLMKVLLVLGVHLCMCKCQ